MCATVSALLHQRGHAVPAARWMALRARDSAPNITALHRLCVHGLVSSQGGALLGCRVVTVALFAHAH